MSQRRRAKRRVHRRDDSRTPSAARPAPQWIAWWVGHGLSVTVIAAAAARLVHWLNIYLADPLYGQTLALSDMQTYWNWGAAIAGGDVLSRAVSPGAFYYAPLYAYFLAGVFVVFGQSFHAVHGMQAFLGAAPPVLLYLMARRLFGREAALATGLMAALCAPFIFYEQTLLGEGLLILIHAGILFCLIWGQDSERHAGRWAMLCGALSGLACWGRGNFLLVIPVLALAWFLTGPTLSAQGTAAVSAATDSLKTQPQPPGGGGRRWGAPAAYLLAAGFVLGITLWRNVHVAGQWILTTANGPVLLYQGNCHDSRGLQFYSESYQTLLQQYGSQSAVPWVRELVRDIAAHPFAFVRLLLKKTWMFWNSYDAADNVCIYVYRFYLWLVRWNPVAWIALVPLGLVGLWQTRRQWRRQVALYLYTGAFAVSIIAVFIVGRYRLQILLPMLLWAGPAVVAIARAAWARDAQRLLRPLAAAAVGIFLLWPQWSPAVRYNIQEGLKGYRLSRPNDYNRMWVAFATLGREAEGRALLERAIKEYPFAEGIALPLAASYLEARRPQDALPVLQAYIRSQGGGERKALLMLAEALSQVGRKTDALEAVRLVLQHNPDDAEASALLLAIQRRR